MSESSRKMYGVYIMSIRFTQELDRRDLSESLGFG